MNLINGIINFGCILLIGFIIGCNNDDLDIIENNQSPPKRIVEITGGVNYNFQYGTEPECDNCFDELWGDVRVLEKHKYNSNGELVSIESINHLGEGYERKEFIYNQSSSILEKLLYYLYTYSEDPQVTDYQKDGNEIRQYEEEMLTYIHVLNEDNLIDTSFVMFADTVNSMYIFDYYTSEELGEPKPHPIKDCRNHTTLEHPRDFGNL